MRKGEEVIIRPLYRYTCIRELPEKVFVHEWRSIDISLENDTDIDASFSRFDEGSDN
jgi:hypothetical protein